MTSPDDARATRPLRAPDPATTRAIGAAFGVTAPDGAVLLLSGRLGAGKTTFAQGVGRGCGVEGPIASPTYNLILRHEGDRPFTHVDLYRLDSATDLETLDLDAILSAGGVTCVEWPEKIADRVVPPFASLAFERSGARDGRAIRVELTGAGWEATRAALEERPW